jgi:hypothetical protein
VRQGLGNEQKKPCVVHLSDRGTDYPGNRSVERRAGHGVPFQLYNYFRFQSKQIRIMQATGRQGKKYSASVYHPEMEHDKRQRFV